MPAYQRATSDVRSLPQRRLSDLITQAISRAFEAGDTDSAGQFVAALESLTKRESILPFAERRAKLNTLVEAKERLILATTAVSLGIATLGGNPLDTAA
jgi:hypothetical protein